ncbi:hypothetical protein KKG31_01975 [Patescibacteria group bacterium]|nr:hypothetical protein [Patescibacteria group bacterium]MBU1757940.1 hypothetical protein [Patescibacteria group bacterium]
MSDFNKKYNAAAVENDIRELWDQDTSSSKMDGIFCSLPLPSSTSLHLGHAENALIQDVFVRYNQLIGKSMDYTPSWYYGSFLANELIQKHLAKL